MEHQTFHRIAAAARLLDVNPATLRAWEKSGAIPPAARRSGQRVYTPQELRAIRETMIQRPARDVVKGGQG